MAKINATLVIKIEDGSPQMLGRLADFVQSIETKETEPRSLPSQKLDTDKPLPTALAPAPAPTDAPEVDANGLPWDARIHSSNKKKTAKGVWTKRKGVGPEVMAQVTAELRSAGATPPPPAAPPTPPTVPTLPAPAVPPTPEVPPVPTAPAAPTPPPVPIDPNTITTLPLFMEYIEKRGVTDDQAREACAAVQISSIAMLGSSQYQACIPHVVAQLETSLNG